MRAACAASRAHAARLRFEAAPPAGFISVREEARRAAALRCFTPHAMRERHARCAMMRRARRLRMPPRLPRLITAPFHARIDASSHAYCAWLRASDAAALPPDAPCRILMMTEAPRCRV